MYRRIAFPFDENLCINWSGCHNKSMLFFRLCCQIPFSPWIAVEREVLIFALSATTSAAVAKCERLDHLFYDAANNSHIGFVNNFEWQPNRFQWRQTTTNFSFPLFLLYFLPFVSILGLRYSPLTFRKFSLISDKQQAFSFAFFSLDDFAINLFSLFKMNVMFATNQRK